MQDCRSMIQEKLIRSHRRNIDTCNGIDEFIYVTLRDVICRNLFFGYVFECSDVTVVFSSKVDFIFVIYADSLKYTDHTLTVYSTTLPKLKRTRIKKKISPPVSSPSPHLSHFCA